MIPDVVCTIFSFSILAILFFVTYSVKKGNLRLIHRLFFTLALAMAVFMGALLVMRFMNPDDTFGLWLCDSTTYFGGPLASTDCLLIALTFINGLEKLPKRYYWLLFIPACTVILAWTNPLHHLMYKHFSVIPDQIVFGPFMMVNGIYCYICMIASIALMTNFAIRNHNRLYVRQTICFSIGAAAPLIVSFLATFRIVDFQIYATPLAFNVTILLDGFAIFYFHILDIKPLATQQILDSFTDGYLVLSDHYLVLDYNKPFEKVFGKANGIQTNQYLPSIQRNSLDRSCLVNLLTSLGTCRQTGSSISYEQPIAFPNEGEGYHQKYYMVEITPLILQDKIGGFLACFKDVSMMKKSIQRLQENQKRMMEQERLASLGQMIGGIAHNLKTPIMAISGGTLAINNLVDECCKSLGDPEVNEDDYRQIYQEMTEWLSRIRESCSYMSDIISAVKGQAISMSQETSNQTFALNDAIKRVEILMRHELKSKKCVLKIQQDFPGEALLQGDINGLVQVLNNLISNAIDAQKPDGGLIELSLKKDSLALILSIRDHGPGVPPEIMAKLFKQMYTSKGSLGTGLGLYISNSIIKAKFNGTMWVDNHPEGGAVFGISIPVETVTFSEEGTLQ